MEDSKKQEGCCMIEENGYVMTITPADNNGSNNVMTIVDCRDNNTSMLVGTIMKVPTNVSNEARNVYKRKMIHLYETFGICSISQNPAEFDGTYNKVA